MENAGKNDWLASQSLERSLDVISAINRISIHAKLRLAGIEDTAKGVGKTVEEGAKYTGEKLKEAGRAAEPQAKSTGQSIRDGAVSFGHGVKNFFTRLFGS